MVAWEDCRWLVASIAASVLWGIADILCDACIGEEEEEEGLELTAMNGGYKNVPRSDKDSNCDEDMQLEDHDDDEENLRVSSGQVSISDNVSNRGGITISPELHLDDKISISSSVSGEDESSLTGTQDCAIAGFSTGIIMYVVALKRLYDLYVADQKVFDSDISFSGRFSMVWSPFEDMEWWVACISGPMMFYHYLFLLKAYDTAPSTVINPLLQVSSTWMIFGTGIVAWFSGEKFITPFDFMCYIIISIGGLLPSLDGNFKIMLSKAFWNQSFVKMTVFSELTVMGYDLLMTYVLRHVGLKEKFQQATTEEIEIEFFLISWIGFVLSFCLQYGFVASYRQQLINLKYIPKNIVYISAFGQALTLLGYYFAQFAFTWYYQAGIVTATEASMSQAFNLLFAVVAFKCFGYGRQSAVDGMKMKVISCAIITVGLFLLATTENQE